MFSAPKYCDMTENKGAFINIGPDYKLKFTKFDAVPHPNIRPMVTTPHSTFDSHPMRANVMAGVCPEFTHVISDVI